MTPLRLLLALLCIVMMMANHSQAAMDPIEQYLSRPRFYVIIAVDKLKSAPADLPYAIVDADSVKSALESAGFKPLSDAKPLSGPDATYANVDTLLRDIRGLPDDSTVVVYYSGHAWTDDSTQDVWLQLYDNTTLGDQGLSFSRLLILARGEGWNGELGVIIDSCYSGKVAFTSQLIGETAVLASSDKGEPSRPIILPSGRISAFTESMLLALGKDFDVANTAHDGLLTFDQLTNFADSTLIEWSQENRIDGPMNPRLFANTTTLVLKYDPPKNSNPADSPLRKIIAYKLIRSQLPSPAGVIQVTQKSNADVLASVRSTVQQVLSSFPEGPEKNALTQIANGNLQSGLAALKQVVDSSSNIKDIDREISLARLYSVAGLDTEAASVYQGMLARNNDLPAETRLAAASAYTAAHQFEQAQSVLSDLIQSKATSNAWTDAVARNNLGLVYAKLGKYKKAESAFKAALNAQPTAEVPLQLQATVSSNLADAYRAEKKVSNAEQQYEQTITLQKAAGTPVSTQVTDLEKYSSVLAADQKQAQATYIKQEAESLKAGEISAEATRVLAGPH